MSDERALFCQSHDCPLNQLDSALRAELKEVEFPKGTTLCRQNDPLRAVFVLCEGSARVVRHSPATDQQLLISFLEPGAVLGYQELFADRACWDASVEMLEPCRLVEIDPPLFYHCLQQSPGFAFKLLQQSLESEHGLQRQYNHLLNQTAYAHAFWGVSH